MAQKMLTADLDVVAGSDIEIRVDPLTRDLDIIQKLDDEPNDVGGLTAQELKAEFDKAGNLIKEYINETLVPEVLSEGIVEAQRQANEAARQAAEAARESRLQTFTGGVTASAHSLPPESAATARAVPEGESFKLEIGVPRGERGMNGAALAADGLWAFNVREDGHLVVAYTGDAPPRLRIREDGHLVANL